MYVMVNGVRLHYQIEGQGPAVLLLHPVGLDLTWWEPQVGALRSEFQVMRLDFRGHGESEVAPFPYTLANFANDAHALIGALGNRPAHVVGLSLGGMVAQVLALEYPEDVRSLVLAATACALPVEARPAIRARGEAAGAGAAPGRAIAALDTLLRLGEIRVPTLVTTGDADLSTPVPAARVIADHIPGAILRVMPGAPHMAPFG